MRKKPDFDCADRFGKFFTFTAWILFFLNSSRLHEFDKGGKTKDSKSLILDKQLLFCIHNSTPARAAQMGHKVGSWTHSHTIRPIIHAALLHAINTADPQHLCASGPFAEINPTKCRGKPFFVCQNEPEPKLSLHSKNLARTKTQQQADVGNPEHT